MADGSMRGILDTVAENLRLDIAEGVQDADVPLTGSLNTKALGEMLPDVTDMRRFMSGVQKVRRGDEESLSLAERGQLAKVMRRLSTVQSKAQ